MLIALTLGAVGIYAILCIPGPAQAPVVVLLHGNAGNISHQPDTVELLSRPGAGARLPNCRGHGRGGGSPDEADDAGVLRRLIAGMSGDSGPPPTGPQSQ